MRARMVLVCSGLAFLAAAASVQACGDTENPPATSVDAGNDSSAATDTGTKKDTAPPDEDAGTNNCDANADFTKEIPDAAIGDSGSTTGLCLQCGNKNCAKQIDDCNKDCDCQGLAGDALDCYLKNQSNPLICAGSFGNVSQSTQQIGIALLGCINSKCKNECATDQFTDGGKDADADAN